MKKKKWMMMAVMVLALTMMFELRYMRQEKGTWQEQSRVHGRMPLHRSRQ